MADGMVQDMHLNLMLNTGTLVEHAPMNTGRWYPTLVTLPDGKVIVVSGFDDFGSYNYLAEVYDPITKSWSISYDPFTLIHIVLDMIQRELSRSRHTMLWRP